MDKLTIRAGLLFDGTSSGLKRDVLIHIAEGAIVRVEAQSSAPSGTEITVDLSNHTVLPGIIDAHMHFLGIDTMQQEKIYTESEGYKIIRSVRDAYRLLEAGFTAVRCLGSPISPILARGIDDGIIPGPRIIAAGNYVGPTGSAWDHVQLPIELMRRADMIADGVPACLAIVRRRVRQGAKVIKTGTSMGAYGDRHVWGESEKPQDQLAQYSLEELQAIVQEAHRLGVKVSSHSIGDQAVRNALDAGIDVIEHGHGMSDETRRRLLDSGKILVPTLSNMHFATVIGPHVHLDRRSIEAARRHVEAQVENFRKCLEAGVRMAAGSDLIGHPLGPHGEQSAELELMVKYGMKPVDALTSATRVGAQALGLESVIGTVEPGRYADLIAVKGDPLQNIQLLKEVDFVMKQGIIFRQNGVTRPEKWLGNPRERLIDRYGGI
jgi:imidazolonepropionase-like amidohydrolase